MKKRPFSDDYIRNGLLARGFLMTQRWKKTCFQKYPLVKSINFLDCVDCGNQLIRKKSTNNAKHANRANDYMLSIRMSHVHVFIAHISFTQ